MTKDTKRKQIIDDDDNVSGSVDDGDGESGSEFAPSPSSSPVPKAKAKAKAPRQGAKKKGTGDADGGDGGVGAGEPAKKKSKKKEPPQEYGVDIAAVCQSTELAEKYNAMKNDDLKGFLKVRVLQTLLCELANNDKCALGWELSRVLGTFSYQPPN
jgi:hypothetical protein